MGKEDLVGATGTCSPSPGLLPFPVTEGTSIPQFILPPQAHLVGECVVVELVVSEAQVVFQVLACIAEHLLDHWDACKGMVREACMSQPHFLLFIFQLPMLACCSCCCSSELPMLGLLKKLLRMAHHTFKREQLLLELQHGCAGIYLLRNTR